MGKTDRLELRAVTCARACMGTVAWPTVGLGLVFALAYLAAVGFTLAGQLSLWLGVPGVAVITYLSYTILHESVHGSITGNVRSLRWLNKSMGYLAAWITMIPFTAHRHEHMAHHRYANDSDKDPDYHVGNMAASLVAPVQVVLQAWGSQFVYYAKNRWSDAPAREKIYLCLEVTAALVPRLAVIMAGYWVEGLALFVCAWILGAIILLYLFAYVVHRPHEQVGRYVDTSTILPPKSPLIQTALNWLWMFQNYHSIHHLFPRVPFYRYAALYREINDVMEANKAPIYSISMRGLEQRTPSSSQLNLDPGNNAALPKS